MPTLDRARPIALPSNADSRGVLTALEAKQDIPFAVKRIFFVHDVQPPYERGGHAHPDTDQVLVCVAGRMKVDLADGQTTQTHALEHPTQGLFIPAMVWTRLYAFTPDAVCVVAASTHYEKGKVIRSWDEYVRRLGVDSGGGPS